MADEPRVLVERDAERMGRLAGELLRDGVPPPVIVRDFRLAARGPEGEGRDALRGEVLRAVGSAFWSARAEAVALGLGHFSMDVALSPLRAAEDDPDALVGRLVVRLRPPTGLVVPNGAVPVRPA